MSSLKESLIALGEELANEKNKAFELWSWLPSYKAAEAAHGDYAGNHMPSVADILQEAAIFISHGLAPTAEQVAEAGDFYQCPCGEPHEGALVHA